MSREDSFFHYLPVNEETMSWGIYVTGAGRAVIRPGEKYPPSGHPTLYQFDWSRGRTLPEFQLVLITDGAGEFESEATGHVQFEGVALFIVFPGVWHRFRPSPELGWSERWLSFNGEMLDQLFNVDLWTPDMAVTRPRDPESTGRRIRRNAGSHSQSVAWGIRLCWRFKLYESFPTRWLSAWRMRSIRGIWRAAVGRLTSSLRSWLACLLLGWPV